MRREKKNMFKHIAVKNKETGKVMYTLFNKGISNEEANTHFIIMEEANKTGLYEFVNVHSTKTLGEEVEVL